MEMGRSLLFFCMLLLLLLFLMKHFTDQISGYELTFPIVVISFWELSTAPIIIASSCYDLVSCNDYYRQYDIHQLPLEITAVRKKIAAGLECF